MKKIKILFQGDSITDAGRPKDNPHDLGPGYPKYAAEGIRARYPDVEFEMINLGISGNQTINLVERLERDFLDIKADIVSILIGVNDTWHHMGDGNFVPDDVFEERYRTVLSAVKATGAKILMIEPYVVGEGVLDFYKDLGKKIIIERKLAREYADAYLPLDGILAAEWVTHSPLDYSNDGVHPNEGGRAFIGKLYVDAVAPLIDACIAEN